jgi:hypothetical protein
MALAVCLLLDSRAEAAVRALWRRLEAAGVPTLLSHTHGRHVPHLTYAALLSRDLDAVVGSLGALPPREPLGLHFDALGTFRRSRCWLAPAVTAELVARQEAVVGALTTGGATLHHHYRPGSWLPHLTLAPRLHLGELPTVAAEVYAVLPLVATGERVAVIDTSTGARHALPHLV